MASESPKRKKQSLPEGPVTLPVLPVRDFVVFPHMAIPLFVGRTMSVRAIEEALEGQRSIFLAAQRAHETENPQPEEIYRVGTIATIMRTLKLPDGQIKILVQGMGKARIREYLKKEPFYLASVDLVKEVETRRPAVEVEAMMRVVKQLLEKIVNLGKLMMPDQLVVMENMQDPGRLSDLIASNLSIPVPEAQQILECNDPYMRLKKISEILGKESEVLTMQQKIQAQAKGVIDKIQREYYLREQLKAIQKELGESDDRSEEVREFKQRIQEVRMPPKVDQEAQKQLSRLEKMHPDSAESGTIRTYLEWMVDLPWAKKTRDKLDIKAAKRVLDDDHYDLEKVKERILEYLAVRKLKKKMRGPILCFVGPPGVGKTSLGRSIARALGREFVRISLGGVRDEAEIRGHRRTYVGSLPGRIIQGIKQAGSNNPVFMMDEVDKIGMDFRGDPSSALLEVLDPEQNHSFSDHYLGVPFDLSNVMFIATANIMDPIPTALRDRMEVIEISGYTQEEKVGIAHNFLIPKQLEEHGMNRRQVHLSDPALVRLINQYTQEAGVRNLEREIANVMRKVARRITEGKGLRHIVTARNLPKYLGIPKFLPEMEQEHDEVGVATGLAWTEAGGEIIYVEATLMKGKSNISMTGHLGEVMKESAQAALSYIRSQGRSLRISSDQFARHDVHIHVPAGAIPKDGPSAGITMATALISAFTNRQVRKDVAMTGEITLRGRVLPVGGLKEKILVARRTGIKTVILPHRNLKDLEDVPRQVRKDLQFVFVERMDEVLRVALKSPGRRPARKAGSRRSSGKTSGRIPVRTLPQWIP